VRIENYYTHVASRNDTHVASVNALYDTHVARRKPQFTTRTLVAPSKNLGGVCTFFPFGSALNGR